MTPYEIGVLLHYYSRAYDHDDIHKNPPIWRPTIQKFMELDLIESPGSDHWDRTYRLTERGRFYVVEGICNVPLPTQRFSIPGCPAPSPYRDRER